MILTLNATPGQSIYLIAEVTDGYYQTRIDAPSEPTLDFILKPDGTTISGYPANTTKIATGLYRIAVTMPTGSTAVGTYIASLHWLYPLDVSIIQFLTYVVNVTLPFGNSSIRPA